MFVLPKGSPRQLSSMPKGQEGRLSPWRTVPSGSHPHHLPCPCPDQPVECPGLGLDRFLGMPCTNVYLDRQKSNGPPPVNNPNEERGSSSYKLVFNRLSIVFLKISCRPSGNAYRIYAFVICRIQNPDTPQAGRCDRGTAWRGGAGRARSGSARGRTLVSNP